MAGRLARLVAADLRAATGLVGLADFAAVVLARSVPPRAVTEARLAARRGITAGLVARLAGAGVAIGSS